MASGHYTESPCVHLASFLDVPFCGTLCKGIQIIIYEMGKHKENVAIDIGTQIVLQFNAVAWSINIYGKQLYTKHLPVTVRLHDASQRPNELTALHV